MVASQQNYNFDNFYKNALDIHSEFGTNDISSSRTTKGDETTTAKITKLIEENPRFFKSIANANEILALNKQTISSSSIVDSNGSVDEGDIKSSNNGSTILEYDVKSSAHKGGGNSTAQKEDRINFVHQKIFSLFGEIEKDKRYVKAIATEIENHIQANDLSKALEEAASLFDVDVQNDLINKIEKAFRSLVKDGKIATANNLCAMISVPNLRFRFLLALRDESIKLEPSLKATGDKDEDEINIEALRRAKEGPNDFIRSHIISKDYEDAIIYMNFAGDERIDRASLNKALTDQLQRDFFSISENNFAILQQHKGQFHRVIENVVFYMPLGVENDELLKQIVNSESALKIYLNCLIQNAATNKFNLADLLPKDVDDLKTLMTSLIEKKREISAPEAKYAASLVVLNIAERVISLDETQIFQLQEIFFDAFHMQQFDLCSKVINLLSNKPDISPSIFHLFSDITKSNPNLQRELLNALEKILIRQKEQYEKALTATSHEQENEKSIVDSEPPPLPMQSVPKTVAPLSLLEQSFDGEEESSSKSSMHTQKVSRRGVILTGEASEKAKAKVKSTKEAPQHTVKVKNLKGTTFRPLPPNKPVVSVGFMRTLLDNNKYDEALKSYPLLSEKDKRHFEILVVDKQNKILSLNEDQRKKLLEKFIHFHMQLNPKKAVEILYLVKSLEKPALEKLVNSEIQKLKQDSNPSEIINMYIALAKGEAINTEVALKHYAEALKVACAHDLPNEISAVLRLIQSKLKHDIESLEIVGSAIISLRSELLKHDTHNKAEKAVIQWVAAQTKK